jgi:hypothetical protein
MASVYKLCREWWNYIPVLSVSQFFSAGFSERKILFVLRVIELCQEELLTLKRKQRPSAVPLLPFQRRSLTGGRENISSRANSVSISGAPNSLNHKCSQNSIKSKRTPVRGPCLTPPNQRDLSWKSPSTVGDPLSPREAPVHLRSLSKTIIKNLSYDLEQCTLNGEHSGTQRHHLKGASNCDSHSETAFDKLNEHEENKENVKLNLDTSFEARVLTNVSPELIYSDEEGQKNDVLYTVQKGTSTIRNSIEPRPDISLANSNASLLQKIYEQQLMLTKVNCITVFTKDHVKCMH